MDTKMKCKGKVKSKADMKGKPGSDMITAKRAGKNAKLVDKSKKMK